MLGRDEVCDHGVACRVHGIDQQPIGKTPCQQRRQRGGGTKQEQAHRAADQREHHGLAAAQTIGEPPTEYRRAQAAGAHESRGPIRPHGG